MIVTDASVWVSFLIPQDDKHAQTVPWMQRVIHTRTRIFAPGLLLIEVGATMARRVGLDEARRTVAMLRRMPYLRLSALDTIAVARSTTVAIDTRLRGADAVYVALAQRLGVPLISWDGEHNTRATALITVYRPDTAPP